MHEYARGIASVLAADVIWSTGYAILSTVLDSTYISSRCKELPVANPMTFCDVTIIVQ